jgi:hypothetical protein
MKLIGLTGLAGSGKDSVGALLRMAGYQRFAFGDCVRQEVADLLENGTVLPEWGVSLNVNVDPRDEAKKVWEKPTSSWMRYILQRHGTEFRRAQDPDYWLKKLVVEFRHARPHHAVITDVRYLNEAQFVRDRGGEIWRVVRPGVEAMAHSSEQEQQRIEADVCLENNSTLYDLAGQVSFHLDLG